MSLNTSHLWQPLRKLRLAAAIATCAVMGVALPAFAQQSVNAVQPSAGDHRKPRIGPVVPFGNLRAVNGLEGLAISPRNEVYAAAQVEQIIYRMTPEGEVSVFANFGFDVEDIFLVGLVVARDGSVYAAVVGCNRTDLNGVWRVDTNGQPTLAFPMPVTTGACGGSIPNALAFDDNGNLYVTESAQGEVWRLGAQGAELWARNDLLKPRPESLNQVGVDGIAYRNNSLWVNNLDTGTMVEIPIQKDGSAGTASLFAEGLGHPDGHQFDVQGNLWVTNIGYEEWDAFDGSSRNILRVSPNGKVEIVISTEQLQGLTGSTLLPASPVFGFGRESSTLFLGGQLLNPDDPNPNVAKVKVGIPGMRLPQFTQPKDKQ
jgi:sugar lactone lactonase YvrE